MGPCRGPPRHGISKTRSQYGASGGPARRRPGTRPGCVGSCSCWRGLMRPGARGGAGGGLGGGLPPPAARTTSNERCPSFWSSAAPTSRSPSRHAAERRLVGPLVTRGVEQAISATGGRTAITSIGARTNAELTYPPPLIPLSAFDAPAGQGRRRRSLRLGRRKVDVHAATLYRRRSGTARDVPQRPTAAGERPGLRPAGAPWA